MQDVRFSMNGHNYMRVDKKKAKIAFNNNLGVLFCASKSRPDSMNSIAAFIRKSDDVDTFDKAVNSYSYYNCNSETGREIWFYIPYVHDKFDGREIYDYSVL